MSFLNIRGASRGLNSTVNADAISLCFGLHFEVREVHTMVASIFRGTDIRYLVCACVQISGRMSLRNILRLGRCSLLIF